MADDARDRWAIFRFSLYGALKNQQYYEPFLILAFRDKGLSFFQIGLLIGFRELCVNLFEVPSGAVADLYGRRLSMIVSFVAFIASFLVFGFSAGLAMLFLAMFLFSIGEAFRTGTHKAMIFAWVRARGREKERTRIYGLTRSWAKMGSALSVVIASALVFWRGDYSAIFLLCVVPYAIGIVNFFGYPDECETRREPTRRPVGVARHLWEALSNAWRRPAQRRTLLESMGFEGVFKIVKDYLQPVVKHAALALPVVLALEDRQRTAVIVGVVYVAVHVLSSWASNRSHLFSTWRGGDNRAVWFLWIVALAAYAALTGALFLEFYFAAILLFVLLYFALNFWRPAQLSRIDDCSDHASGATFLSIESQLVSLVGMVVAPALGLLVDLAGKNLAPVAALGAVVALAAVAAGRMKDQEAAA